MGTFDFAALVNNMHWLARLIEIFSVGAGLSIMFGGFFKLKRYGEMRSAQSSQMTLAAPLIMLLSGIMLLMLPLFLKVGLMAFWGASGTSPLAYEGSSLPGMYQIEYAVVLFTRVLGLGAFVRGVLILSRSGSEGGQPGQKGKAFVHMFAGVLLIHILGTVDLVKQIFGYTS